MSNAKHMVFIENKTCIACLTCCFDSESSFRDPLDGSLAVEKGDEEKMRTNIDQTNGMLTSSIALILTHNTSSSPKTYLHFLYKIPKIRKQFPNYQVLIFEQKDYCEFPLEIWVSVEKRNNFSWDAIKVLSCRDSHSHPQQKFHFSSLPLNLSYSDWWPNHAQDVKRLLPSWE